MRGLIFRTVLALLLVISGKVRADAYSYWCPADHGPEAVFLLNEGMTVSVLLVEGQPPNYMPHQEETVIPATNDPYDLRGAFVWRVEGRIFEPCKKITPFLRKLIMERAPALLPKDEVPIPGRKGSGPNVWP